MSPCQSLVVVLLQACLASLPQQEGNKHRHIKKLLYLPYGIRRVYHICIISLPHLHLELRHFGVALRGEEARPRTRVGLVLIVDNNSGFTLGDQIIYLDDGGLGSLYVLPVQTTILYIFLLLRFGQSKKVRPYNREVFFFHNLCQNCRDSSGVLSWTVSRKWLTTSSHHSVSGLH